MLEQEIQTFAADGAYESLNEGVRLGSPVWRLQYPQGHRRQAGIKIGRVNTVTAMNQKALRLFAANYLPELLKRPSCRGMRGDIAACYAAALDLHDYKHVEHAEIRGCRY